MAPSSKESNPCRVLQSSSSSSSSFIPAISTVAVAQICVSAGYTSAEPAALRSLTSVASLYLQTLAASASSIANTKGRTQSNLLDLIRAIEDLAIAQSGGFAGGSDPTRNLLKSSVLKELRSFVRSVKEVPFPKPIIRKDDARWASSSSARSFAEVGRGAHVPRWLPCFPEGWEDDGRKGKRSEKGEERRSLRWEEKCGIFEQEFKEIEGRRRDNANGVTNKKRVLQQQEEDEKLYLWMPCFPGCREMKKEREKKMGFLMADRERVKFELMTGENSKRKKRKNSEEGRGGDSNLGG